MREDDELIFDPIFDNDIQPTAQTNEGTTTFDAIYERELRRQRGEIYEDMTMKRATEKTEKPKPFTENGIVLNQVREMERSALNKAYSDLDVQILQLKDQYAISTGLALRWLAARRLALHEGTPSIIEAEKAARKRNARVS